jgi:hypothetical protein
LYPEATAYRGPLVQIQNSNQQAASFAVPVLNEGARLHFVLSVTDTGDPPLTRYQRVIIQVDPASE